MYKIVTLLISLTAFLIHPQNTFAQAQITEDEKAIIAYLKLTDKKPDYDAWIKNTEKYKGASQYAQANILKEEKERLEWGFTSYNTEEELITIKAKIRISTALVADNKRVIYTRFVDDRHNETPYFPYIYGVDSIAFIIQELENFQTLNVKPKEVPLVKQYLHDSTPYEAEIEMRIKPISADKKAKLLVDYKEQWLMLGEIAYLKINYYDTYKLQNINLWDYNAPWYQEETQRALFEMFKNPGN